MGSGPRFQLSRMKYILVSTAVVPYLVSADFIRIPGRQPVGGQQDENGCYTSAGYSWCEPLNQCIRSWETDCDVPAPPQQNCNNTEGVMPLVNPEGCSTCQANGGWYVDSNTDCEMAAGGYNCNFKTMQQCLEADICGIKGDKKPFCPLKTGPTGDSYYTAYCN